MASQGPNFPGTAASSSTFYNGSTWTNINNIKADDGSVATASLSFVGSTSQGALGTNFGFSIPGNATILGIQVDVKRSISQSGPAVTATNGVGLTADGGSTFFTKNPGDTWPSSLAYMSYGSSSDLWGTTWTPSQINSSNFGAAIAASANNSIEVVDIDAIRITVTYLPQPTDWNTPTNQLPRVPDRWTYVEKTPIGAAIVPVTVVTGWQPQINKPVQEFIPPQPQYLAPSTFLTEATPFTAADYHAWMPRSEPPPNPLPRPVDQGRAGLFNDAQWWPVPARAAAPSLAGWTQPTNQFVFDIPRTQWASERSFYFTQQQFAASAELAAFWQNTNLPTSLFTLAQLQYLALAYTISPTAFLLGGGQSSGWFTPTEQPYPYVRVNVQEGDLRRPILPQPAIPTNDRWGQPTNLPPSIYARPSTWPAWVVSYTDPTSGFLLSFTGPKVCMASSASVVASMISSVTLCSDDIQFG